MSVVKKKPINLDLFAFAFPITAIASIAHRISGVLLFLAMPFYLFLLDMSLQDESGFLKVMDYFRMSTTRFLTWLVLCALLYHFFAGCRHIIMDLGFFEDRCAARLSAKLLFLISICSFVFIGMWLC